MVKGYSSYKQQSTISSKIFPALVKQCILITTLLQSVCNVVLVLAAVDMLQKMQLEACINPDVEYMTRISHTELCI